MAGATAKTAHLVVEPPVHLTIGEVGELGVLRIGWSPLHYPAGGVVGVLLGAWARHGAGVALVCALGGAGLHMVCTHGGGA